MGYNNPYARYGNVRDFTDGNKPPMFMDHMVEMSPVDGEYKHVLLLGEELHYALALAPDYYLCNGPINKLRTTIFDTGFPPVGHTNTICVPLSSGALYLSFICVEKGDYCVTKLISIYYNDDSIAVSKPMVEWVPHFNSLLIYRIHSQNTLMPSLHAGLKNEVNKIASLYKKRLGIISTTIVLQAERQCAGLISLYNDLGQLNKYKEVFEKPTYTSRKREFLEKPIYTPRKREFLEKGNE